MQLQDRLICARIFACRETAADLLASHREGFVDALARTHGQENVGDGWGVTDRLEGLPVSNGPSSFGLEGRQLFGPFRVTAESTTDVSAQSV